MLLKLINQEVTNPPHRSKRGFWIEKSIIAVILLLWFGGAIFLFIKWFDLPTWAKIVLTVIEVFITIDISSAERILQTYEEYLKS